MKNIEVSDHYYDKIKAIADRLHISTGDVIDNIVGDGWLDEYYEEELKEVEERENSDEAKETICWGRKFWNE